MVLFLMYGFKRFDCNFAFIALITLIILLIVLLLMFGQMVLGWLDVIWLLLDKSLLI